MSKCWVVAVTGRSGSGKSTVSAYYAAQGYPVLDGDKTAREVTQAGSPCLAQLAAAFGSDILDEQGNLQRQLLASRAFATPEQTEKLTQITHPAIVQTLKNGVQHAKEQGAEFVFVDGAVIIGAMFERECDKIIVVTAPEKEAISRIVFRDGVSKQAAQDRLAAQLPESVLCERADYVLKNNGGTELLQEGAEKILMRLKQEKEMHEA